MSLRSSKCKSMVLLVAARKSQVSQWLKYLTYCIHSRCYLISSRCFVGDRWCINSNVVPVTRSRVEPHINVAQRDLSIYQSLVAHPRNSTPSLTLDIHPSLTLDIHSPSSPFVLFHSLFCPSHCQHARKTSPFVSSCRNRSSGCPSCTFDS